MNINITILKQMKSSSLIKMIYFPKCSISQEYKDSSTSTIYECNSLQWQIEESNHTIISTDAEKNWQKLIPIYNENP